MVLATSTEPDLNLNVQDRVRVHLEGYGSRNIPLTIDEIAADLGMPRSSVYQAIHRMEQNNEIELDKEVLPNGRDKIKGIKLIKLQPSGRTYRRAAERSGRVTRIRPLTPMRLPTGIEAETNEDGIPALPAITDYLQKKLAVEEMKERALAAGLDPSVIQFEPVPLAEEAMLLLKLYTETLKERDELRETNRKLGFDLAAEKRNVQFLQNKVKEETRQELLEFNNG
jgi:DNA-binding MarR family transcriptional regulator